MPRRTQDKPDSVVDYRELRAEKARQNLTNAELLAATGTSSKTLSGVLHGNDDVSLTVLKKLAHALGLTVRVQFVPQDTGSQILPTGQRAEAA